MLAIIPNFLTSCNLFVGCVGIVLAFHNGLDTSAPAYCILIAMVFDFLDGFTARLLNAQSEFGKQLDSLADMVSFGLLPAAILFDLFERIKVGMPAATAEYIPFIAFIYAVFAALRLAKFNIDNRQTDSFRGLATPTAALFIASLGLIPEMGATSPLARDFSGLYGLYSFGIITLPIITVVLSLLMVSDIPLLALKFKDLSLNTNWVRYLFIITCITLFIIFWYMAIPMIFGLYFFFSFLQSTTRKKKGRSSGSSSDYSF